MKRTLLLAALFVLGGCRVKSTVAEQDGGPSDSSVFADAASSEDGGSSSSACEDSSGDPLPAGTVCRPVVGVDDVAEVCDGTSLECPADNACAGREDELGQTCDVDGVPCGVTSCIFGMVACSPALCE